MSSAEGTQSNTEIGNFSVLAAVLHDRLSAYSQSISTTMYGEAIKSTKGKFPDDSIQREEYFNSCVYYLVVAAIGRVLNRKSINLCARGDSLFFIILFPFYIREMSTRDFAFPRLSSMLIYGIHFYSAVAHFYIIIIHRRFFTHSFIARYEHKYGRKPFPTIHLQLHL